MQIPGTRSKPSNSQARVGGYARGDAAHRHFGPGDSSIAARAKAAAAEHPKFIRGDQGQVVGVMPDREVYYGPSSGLPDLRRLIGRFWTLAYGLNECDGLPEDGLGAEHVAIVSGATEGIAIVMRLLAPDRAIGVQRFCWGNYRNIIAHAGGEAVTLDFFAPDGSFDLAGLTTAIEAANIRTLLVNFPANPTGDVLSDDELGALAELARERDLVLVSDEVYNWIRYDGKPRTLLEFAPERTLVIGAASKEYLIPGAHTGYVLSNDATFSGEWMPRLIRSTSSSPNVLGQGLAREMLEADVADLETGKVPAILGAIKEELRCRRDAMVRVLRSTGFKIQSRNDGPPPGRHCTSRTPPRRSGGRPRRHRCGHQYGSIQCHPREAPSGLRVASVSAMPASRSTELSSWQKPSPRS